VNSVQYAIASFRASTLLVTVVAQKIGDWHQAHYCYSRVCRLDKKDAESQKLRGEIAANHLGDNKLALEGNNNLFSYIK